MSSGCFRLPLGGGSGFGAPKPRRQRQQRARSASDAAAASSAPPQQGLLNNPVLKSGLVSGSLALAGDVLAQLLTMRSESGSSSGSAASYDAARAARMGTFGLLFYGPYQYFWYGALDRAFPGRTLLNFATKVTLNQLALAPLTISVAFGWNLALQQRLGELPGKLRADFVPTMLNGWKFWVPAATINFTAVPLQYQVLWMSTCGMCWTGYLSYSSAKK